MSAEITYVKLARNWVFTAEHPERYRCDWRVGHPTTGEVGDRDRLR